MSTFVNNLPRSACAAPVSTVETTKTVIPRRPVYNPSDVALSSPSVMAISVSVEHQAPHFGTCSSPTARQTSSALVNGVLRTSQMEVDLLINAPC